MTRGISILTWILLASIATAFGLMAWVNIEFNPIGSSATALMILVSGSIIFILAVAFFGPKHLRNFKPTPNKILASYAIILLIYPFVIYVNSKLDDSKELRQRLPVRSKVESQLRGQTFLVSFFLPRRPEINALGEAYVEVSKPAYDKVDLTDTYVHVELRAGYFGIAWIQAHWLEFPRNR